MAAKTGETIADLFKDLVSDSEISQEFALELENTAKDEIEEEQKLRILLIRNTDTTVTTANTFETAIDLPADFNIEHRIVLIDSGNTEYELIPVPYEDIYLYKDSFYYYSIDYANSKLYITGTMPSSRTVHLHYFKFTPALTWTSSPVWPDRFHRLISYRMAEISLRGVDRDTLTRLQWPAHKEVGDRIAKNMRRWNSRLWMKAKNNRTGFARRRGTYETETVPDQLFRR